MYGIFLTIHIIVAVMLIGLVLIQQGKGAQTGAAFGSGASTTLFGSQGSGNFLSRFTGILMTLFFVISLILAFMLNKDLKNSRALDTLPQSSIEAPVTDTAPKLPVD